MRAGPGPARVEVQLTHGRRQGRGAGLRKQLRGCKPSVDIKEKGPKGGGGRRRPARRIGRAAGAGSGPAPVCVAEALQAAKESLGQGPVARGRPLPPRRSQPRAGGTRIRRKAQRRPARSKAIQPTKTSPDNGPSDAKAAPGRAKPRSGRELTRLGSGPSAGLRGQWCARRRSRRQARAELRCGGRSPTPLDEARIGPGAQCSAHS